MKPTPTVEHHDGTASEEYGDVPDASAIPDPSNPQGPFWHPDDQDRVAKEISEAPLEDANEADRPGSTRSDEDDDAKG
jgi:hypothetical protein